MSCPDMAPLLHGLLDDELELVEAARMEKHLAACAECHDEYERLQQLRTKFRGPAMFYPAPESLRRSIEQSIQDRLIPNSKAVEGWRRVFADWRVGATSSLALAASLVLFIASVGLGDDIRQELISGHVRSLQANHLTDVATSDQHTVKPWFSGKVDLSPPVLDLTDRGYPLAGGRLDYIDGHVAAVLVYRRHQHVINLFVWPASGDRDESPRPSSHQGYHLLHWTQDGLSFWAVSELNMGELRDFVTLYQTRSSPAGIGSP
jgi:anti-sigma factor RsiW